MSEPVGYHLVLPHPWERVPLGQDTQAQVRDIVDRAVARLPSEIPPDQIAPVRRRIEHELLSELRAAQEQGGLDFYLPTDLMHGLQLNASFVVSAVVPDANAEPETAPRVLAALLTDEGARPVSAGGTVWVRTERVLQRAGDDFVPESVDVRRVQYRTAVPDEPRRWLIVTFTTTGDGDADSDITALVVELFDAIMSTWRWRTGADDPGSDASSVTG